MNFTYINFPSVQILLLSSVRIVTICDANLTIPSPDPCLLFDPDCDSTAAVVSLKFIHFLFCLAYEFWFTLFMIWNVKHISMTIVSLAPYT